MILIVSTYFQTENALHDPRGNPPFPPDAQVKTNVLGWFCSGRPAHNAGLTQPEDKKTEPKASRPLVVCGNQISPFGLQFRVQMLVLFLHDPQDALAQIHGQRRRELAAHLGHEGVGRDLIMPAVGIVLILDSQFPASISPIILNKSPTRMGWLPEMMIF